MPDPNPADQQPNGKPSEDSFLQEKLEWWEGIINKPNPTQEERNLVIQKLKGYDKGYTSLKAEHQTRMKELSQREEEIVNLGKTMKSAQESFTKPPTTKVEGQKTLDTWIAEAESAGDYKTASTLMALRKTISEETDIGELRKELQELREVNKTLQHM